MRVFAAHLIMVLWLCGSAASGQDNEAAAITPETPLEEIVCEARFNLDTCWALGIQLLESDPARAAKIMEKSCAFGRHAAGCNEAGKIHLLNRRFVNYDLAYDMFEAACFDVPDIGVGPYGCKFLGHMTQLGLGRSADVIAAHDILIRSCFTHNKALTDSEGCDFLAQSYLSGLDTAERGRSPEAIPLAVIAYARGCLASAPGLCADGAALLRTHRESDRLAAFLEACDAEIRALEDEARTCAEVFQKPDFLPRGYAGGRAYKFETRFKQFWRSWFFRLEPGSLP